MKIAILVEGKTETAFKEHLRGLQAFVESSTPILYEEAYTTGDFR